MKTIKQLEKEIGKMKKNHEGILNESDVCGNCDASGMCDLHRGHVDESLTKNDVLYAELSQTKAIKKMIEDKINKIATDPKELALAGHKRACCMMTLKEILSKIEGGKK